MLGGMAFNIMGKLVYQTYLLSPILMMLVYCDIERGVFMTFVGNSYLGIGHLLVSFFLGMIIFLLFEWQVTRFFDLFIIQRYLSHDRIIKSHYELQINKKNQF